MDVALQTQSPAGFDATVERARAALADEGFGVLTEIDLAGTLKKKIGAEMPRYLILGACNPPAAKQAVEADPRIGVMLPCNVVVRETEAGGPVEVLAFDPMMMAGEGSPAGIRDVAADIGARLGRVIAKLGA